MLNEQMYDSTQQHTSLISVPTAQVTTVPEEKLRCINSVSRCHNLTGFG